MEIVSQNAAAQSATVAGSAQLRFELATSADLDEIVNVNSAAFFDYPTFEGQSYWCFPSYLVLSCLLSLHVLPRWDCVVDSVLCGRLGVSK